MQSSNRRTQNSTRQNSNWQIFHWKIRNWIVIVALLVTVTACTADGINTVTNRGLDYRPIVDMKGVDVIEFQTDLAECKEYAAQIDAGGSALAGALLGATAGAVGGSIIGNAFGNTSGGAQFGAAGGALSGAGGGVVSAQCAQEKVVQRCLAGRGYTLLY